SATICAARAMQEASPTDVPPNFMTCTFAFISPHPYPRISTHLQLVNLTHHGHSGLSLRDYVSTVAHHLPLLCEHTNMALQLLRRHSGIADGKSVSSNHENSLPRCTLRSRR